jgi:hypothetical protein
VPKNLAGYCTFASKELIKELSKIDIDAIYVYGEFRYEPEDEISHDHAFVILKNKIIDLTLTQFDESASEISILSVKDKRYKAIEKYQFGYRSESRLRKSLYRIDVNSK